MPMSMASMKTNDWKAWVSGVCVHFKFLLYPFLLLGWMFERGCLDKCCFGCLGCMRLCIFVFAPVQRN